MNSSLARGIKTRGICSCGKTTWLHSSLARAIKTRVKIFSISDLVSTTLRLRIAADYVFDESKLLVGLVEKMNDTAYNYTTTETPVTTYTPNTTEETRQRVSFIYKLIIVIDMY